MNDVFDSRTSAPDSPWRALRTAFAGLIALAVAMGVGRFAFTPILPMMQVDVGLSLRAAGWLAAANYLGYLIGALCAARLSPSWAIRGGLLLTTVVTFGMGLSANFTVWLVLRLLAGIASAWVLVHVASWTLERLLAWRRSSLSGVVFAGVGLGIAGAGTLCLVLMHAMVDSAHAWQVFGLVSLLLTAALWGTFRPDAPGAQSAYVDRMEHRIERRVVWNADKWRLALCYGAFGFGYIIPATFLPALARRFIADPAVFGWAWPVFGAAAALSTFATARWLHTVDDRRLWAIAHVLMAVGVVLPVLWPGLAAILLAALLVGGTFLVVSMAGLREARRADAGSATAFMGALTAAFAVGQMIGPLVVSAVAGSHQGFADALFVAAAVLLLSAVALWRSAIGAVGRG
ncbi:MAG: YbfB/YjiJ family MFS transporter [Rhodanobacter sp.]